MLDLEEGAAVIGPGAGVLLGPATSHDIEEQN